MHLLCVCRIGHDASRASGEDDVAVVLECWPVSAALQARMECEAIKSGGMLKDGALGKVLLRKRKRALQKCVWRMTFALETLTCCALEASSAKMAQS